MKIDAPEFSQVKIRGSWNDGIHVSCDRVFIRIAYGYLESSWGVSDEDISDAITSMRMIEEMASRYASEFGHEVLWLTNGVSTRCSETFKRGDWSWSVENNGIVATPTRYEDVSISLAKMYKVYRLLQEFEARVVHVAKIVHWSRSVL